MTNCVSLTLKIYCLILGWESVSMTHVLQMAVYWKRFISIMATQILTTVLVLNLTKYSHSKEGYGQYPK